MNCLRFWCHPAVQCLTASTGGDRQGQSIKLRKKVSMDSYNKTQIRTYLLLNQFKDMPQGLLSTTTVPLRVSLKD